MTSCKELVDCEDNPDLLDSDNFDILMSIVNSKNSQLARNKNCVLTALSLILPWYQIGFNDVGLILTRQEDGKISFINKKNFLDFRELLIDLGCFRASKGEQTTYNPKGDLAQEIAAKLQKGRQIASESNGEANQSKDTFSHYLSVVATVTGMPLTDAAKMKLPQLLDMYERIMKRIEYESYVANVRAGGEKNDDIVFWASNYYA